MLTCEHVQGLIAASLYERLSEEDQRCLDSHMADCDACRAVQSELAETVSVIPKTPVPFTGDLRPMIRAEIQKASARYRQHRAWRWALGSALAAMLLIAVFLVGQGPDTSQPTVTVQPEESSPITLALATLDTAPAADAYKQLDDLLAAHPDDPAAPQAELALAGLAYEQLHWYDAAQTHYDRFVREYPEAFADEPQRDVIIVRRNLLDETKSRNYAALHALDAAVIDAIDGDLAPLETLIANHAGTYVASVAAETMGQAVLRQSGESASAAALAHAMETARNQCTNPVAISQLNLEIGHLYRGQLNNNEQARFFYSQAANTNIPKISSVARDALARLE